MKYVSLSFELRLVTLRQGLYRRASWRKTLINLPANVCRCLSHNWDLVFELTLQGGIMSCGAWIFWCAPFLLLHQACVIHPPTSALNPDSRNWCSPSESSLLLRPLCLHRLPATFSATLHRRSSSSLSYLSHEFPLMFSDVFHGGESNRALLYVVGGRLVWNIQPVN